MVTRRATLAAVILGLSAAVIPGTPTANATNIVIPGWRLDTNQSQNARTIVRVTKGRNLPRRAAVIAVATAWQETSIRVYANRRIPQSLKVPHQAVGENLNSVGLFQQQIGPGFQLGSFNDAPKAMDPTWSTNAFLDRVIRANPDDWHRIPLTEAAQAAQQSGLPDAYAKWEDEADAVVTQAGWSR